MIGDQRNVRLRIGTLGLRIADLFCLLVSLSPCLLVSLSSALGIVEYAERDVLQYAVPDDQQAFFAEFPRHRAEDHLAQFSRGLIEFGFLPGLSRMLLLKRFTVRRLIARCQQFLDAPRGLIDFLDMRKAVTADRVRGD